jgi:hypothetical protein
MAITRTVKPTVIVLGTATRTRELRRKIDNTLYGYEVVVQQDSGAQVAVTMYEREGAVVSLPSIGDMVAAECTVDEHREYGATLVYEGSAASALDLIGSRA